MQNPINFYISEKDRFTKNAKVLKNKLSKSSLLRLVVFIITIFALYYFYGNLKLVLTTSFIGLILFIYLIVKHGDLSYQQKKTKELININQKEINVLNGDYKNMESSVEFIDPEFVNGDDHWYSGEATQALNVKLNPKK